MLLLRRIYRAVVLFNFRSAHITMFSKSPATNVVQTKLQWGRQHLRIVIKLIEHVTTCEFM